MLNGLMLNLKINILIILKFKKIFLSLNTIFCDLHGKKGSIDKIRCFKNKFFFIKSKNVILSCGGIENNRLLLLSLKNNKSLFKFDLPIGKYFMDHPKQCWRRYFTL